VSDGALIGHLLAWLAWIAIEKIANGFMEFPLRMSCYDM
jgi:hypothetical protein